jgi:hypothetical protein
MPSFYQPRPRPGFLIDTSASMDDSQLARAVAELGGLTRQLGYGADVVRRVLRCRGAQREKVFRQAQVELYGGGGTDIGAGLRAFIERRTAPIDLLVIVERLPHAVAEPAPPFPVITIRVGDGTAPSWGDRRPNQVITIQEPAAMPADTLAERMRRWRRG